MKNSTFAALLRGINVGGNNVIKMSELKALFEEIGFTNVSTYIQSGNVIFNAGEETKTAVIAKIEEALQKKLGNPVKTALFTAREMKKIIAQKPAGFGEEKELYKYDVIFLLDPLCAKDAVKRIKTREGVDALYEGPKAVYVTRLISSLTKSYLSKIAGTPIYQNITIRNWNTTQKLNELLNGARLDATER
jgi:uncharacterized protein (DUF1697 family)